MNDPVVYQVAFYQVVYQVQDNKKKKENLFEIIFYVKNIFYLLAIEKRTFPDEEICTTDALRSRQPDK